MKSNVDEREEKRDAKLGTLYTVEDRMPANFEGRGHGRMQNFRRTAVLLLGLMCTTALSAQPPARADSSKRDGDTCYRFSFGAWTPPLDLRAAGHEPPSRPLPGAAPGRDWATETDAKGAAALMLYPAWWPAGVLIELPRGAPALGDTAKGKATALVADARTTAPTAIARAWGLPCAKSAPERPR